MPHTHLDASLTIDVPAQRVFDRMNDLSRFNDWNPFPSMDATTQSHHEGPAAFFSLDQGGEVRAALRGAVRVESNS